MDSEKIKKNIREFFDLAEIGGSLVVNFQEPGSIKISLQTEEAPILIGEKGETLLAFFSGGYRRPLNEILFFVFFFRNDFDGN